MEHRFVVSYKGKAKQFSVEDITPIVGKRIGDVFDGSFIGLDGYLLEIRGGTDKDGFPMTNWIDGPGRKRLILTRGPGIKIKKKGLRKRKMVRGNTISAEIAQINVKVVKEGSKKWEEFFEGEESESKE